MIAACAREVHAAGWTYALRIMRTASKSFRCKGVAFNVRDLIGRSFSAFVHGPGVRRKSSTAPKLPICLFKSANCPPADTPDSARPCRARRLA